MFKHGMYNLGEMYCLRDVALEGCRARGMSRIATYCKK